MGPLADYIPKDSGSASSSSASSSKVSTSSASSTGPKPVKKVSFSYELDFQVVPHVPISEAISTRDDLGERAKIDEAERSAQKDQAKIPFVQQSSSHNVVKTYGTFRYAIGLNKTGNTGVHFCLKRKN